MYSNTLVAAGYFAVASYSLSKVKTANLKENNKNKYGFWVYLPLFLIVRLALAVIFPGHETDMNCWSFWSDALYKNGITNFYSSDFFSDYPPGYMYVLWIIGFLKNTLSLNGKVMLVLLKLPAIISDILCGYILYKIAKDKFTNKSMAIIMITFILNPAIVVNSSVWGQVDSVLTVFILWTLYLLYKDKLTTSYYIFMIALIIKPQAIFFGPVLLFATIDEIFIKGYKKEKFINCIKAILLAVAMGIIIILPFGFKNVIDQYIKTLASYNYATVNAYNLWSALGMNFKEPTLLISLIGYASIIATVAISAVIYFKTKTPDRVFYIAAFICLSVFVLSVKMHERYTYPSIILFLAAFCVNKKKPDFFAYGALSAIQYVNYIQALFYYRPQNMYPWFNDAMIAGGTVMTVFYIVYCSYFVNKRRKF